MLGRRGGAFANKTSLIDTEINSRASEPARPSRVRVRRDIGRLKGARGRPNEGDGYGVYAERDSASLYAAPCARAYQRF